MDVVHPPDDPATSFGAAAEQYDHARPDYPDEVVEWLLDGIDGPVVDVGAGTGKLTAALAARRDDVIAVEPDAAMRAVLSRGLPRVLTVDGTGESIDLPDGSATLLTFAQAWHWVDVDRASAEVARVLSRPGRLGLVWNHRDETDPWVDRLSAALGGKDSAGQADDIQRDGPTLSAPFDGFERIRVPWQHRMDVESLVDLAASRSYVIVRPEHERPAVLDAVRALAEERADAAGTVLLPYVASAFRADLA